MLTLLLALAPAAFADVVINEVMVDPTGADADNHWLELHNTGTTAVDLTDWTLSRAKSSYNLTVVLSGTIAPGGYFLITEPNTPGDLQVPLLDFGNAGSNSDAIRLSDDNAIIQDILVYGSPNTDGWDDDVRLATTLTAPTPVSGDTLSRIDDGVDTDDSSIDFDNRVPTPGGPNNPPVCDPATVGVLINEALPNPSGTDTDNEWVELINTSGAAVDVSGWRIEAGTSTLDTLGIVPSGTTIPAGGLLVVGQSALPEVDVVAAGFEMGNAGTNADAVRIADCFGTPADTLVYGSPNSDGWLDDAGGTAAGALAPFSGRSLGRVGDGVDSDDSSADFTPYAVPTPGALNPLVLFTTDIVPGSDFTMYVRGAEPGARVYFGRDSRTGAGPCPASLSGLCLELTAPVLMGSTIADAAGEAELTVRVPGSAPLGVDQYFQAASLAPSADVSVVVLETSTPAP